MFIMCLVFIYCIQQRFFCEAGFFFFIRVSAKGAEKWCGDFVWKLAYKQKHHTIPHIGEQPNTYKKGLFLVFVYIQVITPGY